MKEVSIVLLGLGQRGSLYGQCALKSKIPVKIAAICDINPNTLKVQGDLLGVDEEHRFNDENDLFAAGKLADAIAISTLDKEHYREAVKAIELGYHILLEKPISPDEREVADLGKRAKEKGVKVAVCHVLRYTPFFRKLKELIDDKIVGDVININHTENVGYWHQVHSFVRGNFRNSDETSPMILQKCCHDFDILSWLANSRCDYVSSIGDLTFFKKENAPEGSAAYCCDCMIADECPYNAYKIYEKRKLVPIEQLSDKNNRFARCVFHCDNNVVDHQLTNMKFENGVCAHLTMTGFTKEFFRRINVFCTYGVLEGRMEDNVIAVHRFNGEETTFDLTGAIDKSSPHSGGDRLLFEDFIKSVAGDATSKGLTSFDNSVQSHMMAFAAETSRLQNGAPINL